VLSYLVVSVFVVIPLWRIIGKAGINPALSFFTVVPVLNLALPYYIAFSWWPTE